MDKKCSCSKKLKKLSPIKKINETVKSIKCLSKSELRKEFEKNFFQMNVNTNLYFFSSFKGKKMYHNIN